MSTHKWIDAVCVAVIILALLVTVLFMNGASLGLEAAQASMGYEQRLFDGERVHTIDLQVEDWEGFLGTCTDEEYVSCRAVIDGEAFTNIGLRAKGNTSLSTVSSMGSQRYSFKLEFDQYDKTKSYYGLDKLSLNNLIQDNTLMKDYLTYQLMGKMGAQAPLCSYVYITVNGENWGLYLAVEAIEESFLQRNYGSDYGDLYKPDAMSNGGGRGNGKDFDMEQWNQQNNPRQQESALPQKEQGMSLPTGQALKEALEAQGIPAESLGDVDWETVTFEELMQTLSQLPGMDVQALMGALMGGMNPGGMNPGGMNFGGMAKGSADVKLQYVDDNPDSYSNIFNNAKTNVTAQDQTRLIQSLKKLSSYEELETVLDMDSILRYFVVHTFVCNEDSYTGSMIHNYYLYEHEGQLSMLPWDYNLAFGGFQSGDASSVVNSAIDDPVSGGGSDRPMFSWITSDEAYLQEYHRLYQQFLDLLEADPQLVSRTAQLIRPYVDKDPTKFCTTEEFDCGVAAMEQFLQLRGESVRQQLAGQEGTVDASDLNLSDMGSMNQGKGNITSPQQPDKGEGQEGGNRPQGSGQMGGFPNSGSGDMGNMRPPEGFQGGMPGQMEGMQQFPGGGANVVPDGFDANQPFGNGQPEIPTGTPMSAPGEGMPQRDPMPLIITIGSLAVLAIAIWLACKFKRRK